MCIRDRSKGVGVSGCVGVRVSGRVGVWVSAGRSWLEACVTVWCGERAAGAAAHGVSGNECVTVRVTSSPKPM
eukprot:529886-Prymnesium_polylepis.1